MERSTIETQIGAKVRKLRKKSGLSQVELAHRAGMHRTYISDVERGKRNISLRCIEKIAGALRVPIAALFSELSDKPND